MATSWPSFYISFTFSSLLYCCISLNIISYDLPQSQTYTTSLHHAFFILRCFRSSTITHRLRPSSTSRFDFRNCILETSRHSLQQLPRSLQSKLQQSHVHGSTRCCLLERWQHFLLDVGQPILQRHQGPVRWSSTDTRSSTQLEWDPRTLPYFMLVTGWGIFGVVVGRDQDVDGQQPK